jgi:hypothetical protein
MLSPTLNNCHAECASQCDGCSDSCSYECGSRGIHLSIIACIRLSHHRDHRIGPTLVGCRSAQDFADGQLVFRAAGPLRGSGRSSRSASRGRGLAAARGSCSDSGPALLESLSLPTHKSLGCAEDLRCFRFAGEAQPEDEWSAFTPLLSPHLRVPFLAAFLGAALRGNSFDAAQNSTAICRIDSSWDSYQRPPKACNAFHAQSLHR